MNKKTLLGFALGVAMFFIGWLICCNHITYHEQTSEHNLKVAMDSVRTSKLKNGELVSTINSYILEKGDLQKFLGVSEEKVKELEKKVGKVAYISNIHSVARYDSIEVHDTITVTPEGITTYNISYNDKWLKIHGISNIKDNIATTKFDTISIPVPLQVGLTDDYQIWVTSDNPYLRITDIRGAVIEGSRLNVKQKKWKFGVQWGFGVHYNMTSKDMGYGPYCGIGASYNF